MRATLPINALDINQTQECLADQASRLQGVSAPLAVCEETKLVIHKRSQSIQGRAIAKTPRLEQRRHFRWRCRVHHVSSGAIVIPQDLFSLYG